MLLWDQYVLLCENEICFLDPYRGMEVLEFKLTKNILFETEIPRLKI